MVKNILISKFKKAVLITAFFLFTNASLYADISFAGYIYSDNLKLNTFDNDVEIINYKESNNAIGNYDLDLNYHYDKYYTVGINKQKNITIFMNDGFIKTWNFVNQNFDKLLNSQQIADSIGNIDIKGHYSLVDSYKIYIEKNIYHKNHIFKIKLNTIKAKDFQSLQIVGQNKNKHFLLDIDYFYSSKNIITKDKAHKNNYSGSGYSIDLNYKYNYKKFTANISLKDLFGAIYWNNITHMKYVFDSNTRYLGDDGYYHLRGFGQGKYYYNTIYKQKLQIKYDIFLNYKLNNSFLLNNNIIGIEDTYFNHSFITYSKNNFNFSLGKILTTNTKTYGFRYKLFNATYSNTSTNTKSILLSLKIKF